MQIAAALLAVALVTPLPVDASTSLHPHSEWTGQVTRLDHGASILTRGSTLTYTAPDGKTIIMHRSDPDFHSGESAPPPRAMSCASLLQTIQLAPLTKKAWRRAVVTYSSYCL